MLSVVLVSDTPHGVNKLKMQMAVEFGKKKTQYAGGSGVWAQIV
jgi:hypothetical protein